MKPELKILLGSSSKDTVVFVNDQAVGLIQSVTIHVSVNNHSPEVEIVFPDLFDPSLSHKENQSSREALQKSLSMLSPFPYVKIRLEKIVFNDS